MIENHYRNLQDRLTQRTEEQAAVEDVQRIASQVARAESNGTPDPWGRVALRHKTEALAELIGTEAASYVLADAERDAAAHEARNARFIAAREMDEQAEALADAANAVWQDA